ncbi:MAG: BamA/TamA family outer membrane protein, partial [Candidatus Caldatribacteriota bacterium]|nr:BamA/TamA family outer membrane protein [Candidatus Caldatribacteriota bacterium]
KHHHLQKIAIIMEDFTDYALGFASTFPHRVIRISLTGPTAKSFDMKFKSWLKMVITHEYTHIAHYEMTSKLTTALRALFGQILTPNALQPIWSIEGLAVYNETKFTTGGRGIDTRYDMYLRMAALKNKFNTLDQINGYYLTSWPDGTAPYVYGQSLIHFIAQRYGEDKIVTLSDIFSCYPFFGFNYALKRTLGLSLDELYKAWKDSIKDKYETQKQNIISSKTLTKSQQLTEYNYWVDYPRWLSTPEEDKIAIRVSTPHSYPFIQTLDPSSSSFTPLTYSTIKNQSLIKRTYGRNSTFSISPDNSKIIYAKLDNYKQYYKFYDLYLLDLKTEKDIRLSEGLRARDPSWSPDPDNPQIVTVINQSGINNLALINIDLESLKSSSKNSKNHDNKPIITKEDLSYLTNFQDDTQLYQPSWSPNGEMIVLSAWHNGSLDIYSLDLTDSNQDYTQKQNDTLTPIFQDHHNDLSPCWSPDSKYIFFSSDRTGIYNIFAFSSSNKKLYQITNVLGGAFEPSLSPDGKQLAYIEYHASGYELHLMEINPKQWSEIKYDNLATKTNIPKEDINTINISSKDNYPIHPYNSLSSFWPPTYWIPAAQLTEIDLSIGFSSVLEDVLGFSSLPFTITYGLLNNNLNYYFNYYNYRYLPIINFYLSGSTPLSNQNQNTTDSQSSWWKEGKTGINIYFPSKGQTASTTNSRPYSQNFSLGYQYEKSSAAVDDNSSDTSAFSNTNPTQEKIGSIRLSYSYSDAEKYGFSFSPEQGQAFSLSYEHADKAFGGDYTFDKLLFDGRKFIPLPSLHHTLSLRLIAGHSSADILDEEKFNLGGHYSADNLANIDLDTFSLRGYKSALLEGNNLLLTTLEYRFPIANIEHTLKIGPFSTFLERLSGSFFIDIGNAWESTTPNTSTDTDSNANSENDEINSSWYDFKTGIGVELKADFSQKFDIPFTVRLGAAKALSTPKGYDIYFALGTSF